MRKSDEMIKMEFEREVGITRAIQDKAEELRKARKGTSKYRDALISVGLCNGSRTVATRCYLFGLEKNRPEHYARFLEDEAELVAYAKKLEKCGDLAPMAHSVKMDGNVIYGAFLPFSQENEKAGISPLQRAMANIGITTPATRLRRIK